MLELLVNLASVLTWLPPPPERALSSPKTLLLMGPPFPGRKTLIRLILSWMKLEGNDLIFYPFIHERLKTSHQNNDWLLLFFPLTKCILLIVRKHWNVHVCFPLFFFWPRKFEASLIHSQASFLIQGSTFFSMYNCRHLPSSAMWHFHYHSVWSVIPSIMTFFLWPNCNRNVL